MAAFLACSAAERSAAVWAGGSRVLGNDLTDLCWGCMRVSPADNLLVWLVSLKHTSFFTLSLSTAHLIGITEVLKTESSVLEIPVSQKFKYLGFAAWQQQKQVQSWGVSCLQTKFRMSTGIFMRELSPMVIIFSPCCCLGIATYFKDSWTFQGTWSNISGALFLFCFEGILLEAFVDVWSCEAVTNLEASSFSLTMPPASLFSSTQGRSPGWPDGRGASSGEAQLAFLLSPGCFQCCAGDAECLFAR